MKKELTAEQKQWIKDKVKSMSVREKIAQITCVNLASLIWGTGLTRDASLEEYKRNADKVLAEMPIGNLFIGAEIIHESDGNADTTHDILEYIQSKADVPMLVAGDIEYGVGASVKGMTTFPNIATLAAIDDEAISYEMGKQTAIEASAVGFNWVFGPVVDTAQNWLGCGHGREISDDPNKVIKHAKAFIRGLNEHNVGGCAKHFPGNGVDFRNSHIALTTNTNTREQWLENDGKVYKELAADGLLSVMTGHSALRWAETFDEKEHAYAPATLSAEAVNGTLRDMIGFDGVVVSDSIGMAGYKNWKNRRQRAIELFNAGNDIMLFPGKEDYRLIEEVINSGEVSMETVDKSVERVLTMKMKLDLFERVDEYARIKEIQAEAEKLNDLLSEKCVTCVRDLHNLLPLSKDKIKTMLVVRFDKGGNAGPNADFIRELEKMGIELDIHTVEDFADWDTVPRLSRELEEGKTWDAYIQLYDYSYIGDYRPGGLAAQAVWRSAGVECVEPILISFASPYVLYDMPHIKTFITTFSSKTPKVAKNVVRALFGEIEFNRNLPSSNFCDELKI